MRTASPEVLDPSAIFAGVVVVPAAATRSEVEHHMMRTQQRGDVAEELDLGIQV
jgi:hypothetical protein